MPCDTVYRRLQLEEQVKLQREREEALERLERELAAGIAQLTVLSDGTVQLVGELPSGMEEACTLAALQMRGSVEFQYALASAGVQEVDFVTLHNRSHGR